MGGSLLLRVTSTLSTARDWSPSAKLGNGSQKFLPVSKHAASSCSSDIKDVALVAVLIASCWPTYGRQ